jgi:anaerobic selenocysteine-containing dehydrogenase
MSEKLGRRSFVRRTGQLALGGLLGGVVLEAHADKGFTMDSATEGQCATCRFWGGIRKVSEDGKSITTQSLGWCNNPKSMSFQKMTPPDFGPMKSWTKWEALG